MTTPTNQPNVFLLGLCCIAIFCFYSFPMVIFSWLSQSNRQATINPCKPGNSPTEFSIPLSLKFHFWKLLYPFHSIIFLFPSFSSICFFFNHVKHIYYILFQTVTSGPVFVFSCLCHFLVWFVIFDCRFVFWEGGWLSMVVKLSLNIIGYLFLLGV